MIKLNLGPQPKRQPPWSHPSIQHLLLAASISLCFWSVSKLHSLRLEHTRRSAALFFTLERNLTATKSSELIRRNQQLRDDARQRIALLNDIRRSTEILIRSLDLISSCLPDEGIWLTGLRLQQSEVIAKGRSSSFSAVTDLVGNLDRASYLSDVTLQGWSEQAPGFIFETMSAVISIGAGRPGMSAVVMTMSCAVTWLATSSACFALYSADISLA